MAIIAKGPLVEDVDSWREAGMVETQREGLAAGKNVVAEPKKDGPHGACPFRREPGRATLPQESAPRPSKGTRQTGRCFTSSRHRCNHVAPT